MTAQETGRSGVGGPVSVRPLRETDLECADEICREAFGTFLGIPDPFGTADYVRARFAADPHAAFAATVDGDLDGSNFAANWGSVGFLGPLTVRPDLWDQGVGQSLMEPIMGCFETWGNSHLGLFTFSHSPKHLELFRRHGFWPRFLTAAMRKQVAARGAVPGRVTYAEVSAADRPDYLGARVPWPTPCMRVWTWNARSWPHTRRDLTTPYCCPVSRDSTGWPCVTADPARRPVRTCAS